MTTNEPRYYIDGKPAKVINVAPNGFMNIVYDGAKFLTYIQVGEAHDWKPCDKSEYELESERATARAAELGFKL